MNPNTSLAEEFAGQEKVVKQLQTEMDVSYQRGVILPHILLVAPPGMGKTYLAEKVAYISGAPFCFIEMPADIKLLLNFLIDHKGVLLIDEIHQMDRKTSDTVLPFLSTGEIRMNYIRQQNRRLTIIGATTDPQKLPPALVSRFPIRPNFEEYSVNDIEQILIHHRFVPEDIAPELAKASLNNPRQANELADAYHRLKVIHDGVTPDRVLEHVQITKDGLRGEHIRYIEALRSQTGVASQATIAQMMSMATDMVRPIERDLLRLGIIGISNAGRELRSAEWLGRVQSTEDNTPKGADINPWTGEPRRS